MDPIAHTFTGAALAATGLRKVAPAATAALLIGANVPDVDVLASFAGDFRSLELRRGWTHGIAALLVWPFVVTGLLLLWARWRGPRGAPGESFRLLGIAVLAVWTHPTLDWLNNYGLRWLMPFDERWFYGDAVFIVDPWIWLVLGGAVFLRYSRRPASITSWAVFWIGATGLIFANVDAPVLLCGWIVGLIGLLALRLKLNDPVAHAGGLDRCARAAMGIAAVYIGACVAINVPAEARAREAMLAAGIGPVEDLMVAPMPADPLAGFVVAVTPTAYHVADWHWLGEPQLALRAEPIPTRLAEPAVQAALRTELARRFLVWSRYPYAEVTDGEDGGYTIALRDARYSDRNTLFGPVVHLDRNLIPLDGDPK
jgi:inner membrane protein